MTGIAPAAGMPALPVGEPGPVFREPWQAQIFAIVLKLYQAGHFTWPEWVDCLGAEITAARKRGEADLGDTYYLHWLAAFERLLDAKGLALSDELAARRAEVAANPPDRHGHAARRDPVAIG